MKTSHPNWSDLKFLSEVTAPACVSIFLPTTPISVNTEENRLLYRNLAREALDVLSATGSSAATVARFESELAAIGADASLWSGLGHGLAIFTWGEETQLFSLSDEPLAQVFVSDRLHLKPLIGEVGSATPSYVLALSQNAVRFLDVAADGAAYAIDVPRLPKDVAEVAGEPSDVDRSMSALDGREGQKVRMGRFAHAVSRALKPVLATDHRPVILAATQPLESIFRLECDCPDLHPEPIHGSPDRMTDAELGSLARVIVRSSRGQELEAIGKDYELKSSRGLATDDVARAALAATGGAVETLVVNLDSHLFGRIDEMSGEVSWAGEDGVIAPYELSDEIARRVLRSGGEVLAAHSDDIPEQAPLIALLRYEL